MPYKPFHTFNFDPSPYFADAGGAGAAGVTTGYNGSPGLNVLGGDGNENASVPAFSIYSEAGGTFTFLGPGSDNVYGRHGVTFTVGVGANLSQFFEIPIRRVLGAPGRVGNQVTIFTQ